MKKSFAFVIVVVALTLLFMNTAGARQVFVPGQFVNGRGYVPAHWMAVPDSYGNQPNLLGPLTDYAIQDQKRRDNGAKNLANALEQLGNSFHKQYMNKLGKLFMQWGDYSKSGVREFARKYNVSLQDMVALMRAKRQLGW